LAQPVKNVLFVCVQNACRSQIAEAYANIYGQGIIKAYSAGSRPSGAVHPKAIAAMHDAGYDLSVHISKGLDAIPDIKYDLLVTMGCGDECPAVSARQRLDWDIPDPKNMSAKKFAAVRDLLGAKVQDLIKKI